MQLKRVRKSWKQPVPNYNTLLQICKNDEFAATILSQLILRAFRNDMEEPYYVGDTPVSLERGQAIFGSKRWARAFGLKENEHARLWRKLCKLEGTLNLIEKHKYRDCTVVTILNYDDFIYMEKPVKEQWYNNEKPTRQYKIDKTYKTNKIIPLTNKEEELINEIVEWLNRPIFMPIYSERQTLNYVKGLLKNLGYEKLVKIYKDTGKGADPHPSKFNAAVKKANREIYD